MALLKKEPATARRDELGELFHAHYAAVFTAAYRVTGNAMDAEDVLQSVFLRLARRAAEFEVDPVAVPFYLRRAAVNGALDLLRSSGRRAVIRLDGADASHVDGLPRGAEDPESDVELRAALRRALAAESPRSAEIFALRYFEGYGNHEIADMLGTSPSAVGVVLHRTRARLREALGDETEEPMRSAR